MNDFMPIILAFIGFSLFILITAVCEKHRHYQTKQLMGTPEMAYLLQRNRELEEQYRQLRERVEAQMQENHEAMETFHSLTKAAGMEDFF